MTHSSFHTTTTKHLALLAGACILLSTRTLTLAQDVSAECLTETKDLDGNENLTEALSDLLDNYRKTFDEECELTPAAWVCEYEIGSDNTTAYHNLCSELGGQIYEHPVVLDCGTGSPNYGRLVSYDAGAVPQCVGRPCDASKDLTELQTTQIEDFGTEIGGSICELEFSSAIHDNRVAWTASIVTILMISLF